MTALARPAWAQDTRLAKAQAHARNGEALQAELLLRALLTEHPTCLPAAQGLARLAAGRDDFSQALHWQSQALQLSPDDAWLHYDQAELLWQARQPEQAMQVAGGLVGRWPEHFHGWMLLGDMLQAAGQPGQALRAWYQSIKRAQQAGHWLDEASTPPEMLSIVQHHVQALNQGQRDLYFGLLEKHQAAHGRSELQRVELALRGYLGMETVAPADPRQQPKFFYMPGLPEGPFHDPYLLPWAEAFQAEWRTIRAEAEELLRDDKDFESFLGFKPGQDTTGYVGGANPAASWDAYFFYRRGQRFDDHHARCPRTSAILEASDLCRIQRQTPEVCFSLLRPQSIIEPHYGVTNTRLVLHLPLIVPERCALDVVGFPPHEWREGELFMFDDTYQHGAHNHSSQARLIVLMDCWNPHVRPPERQALNELFNAMDSFETW